MRISDWSSDVCSSDLNRNWEYCAGLSAEEAAAREREERGDASGYSQTSHYAWAGPGDGTRSRDEMRALEVLELEVDAGFGDVKLAYRRLAKVHHPDTNKDDAEAAKRFHAVQKASEVLRKAEERRTGQVE